MPLGDEVQPKLIDQSRFTGAGDAADPDPDRVAGMRQQQVEKRFRIGLVVGLGALDQGDGAGERDPVAGSDGLGGLLDVLPGRVLAGHGMRVGANQGEGKSEIDGKPGS